ncbi:restriction endonuclease subunit S [Flavobacterium lindanitolerans]|uniref:restriction endonuclease subunit S n=1 Tax=Flavobacterium lindanitolerans TaxID=428988 RepID=UPI00280768D1|nr:restriction endonuclease subunit S [Flavobacterium lindanitolerans]MDQ7961425.1 restriction endonuclease subunit S [Flavobacterium lindanitolerans]
MKLVKLKDITEITMGQSPEAEYVTQEKIGLPLLNGPAEFTNKFPIPVQYTSENKRVAQINDILFCVRGSTTGRMNIADQKYAIGRGLASIRHKKNSELNSYIKALIEVNLKKLLNGTLGSVFPNVTKDNLFELECYIHDCADQNKIASILTALDDKIELNNSINTELEQMAKTLYDYWFVQFDFPNEDGKPYKSSGGKMVYNEVLKREIPKKWEVSVFNNWIENTKTGDWGKDKIEGNYTERVYCIRGADINGLNGKGEVKAPERFILKNNLSKKLQPNDFIIEISGGSPTQSTARIALLTKESFERFDTNVVCSNFCKAITLKDETYAYNFQQEWQRLYDAGVFFGYEGKTSGIKNFLFESFMDSYFVVEPPKELVLKFNSFAKEIEKKKQLNLKQNKELTSLRDWLLPMLMNGQVKVVD